MKVKRGTVFFLMLVSLAAVISVYYLFEKPSNFDMTAIFTDESLDGTIVTNVGESPEVATDSYVFEEIRMEQSNERSQLREQLTQKIASSEYSAEEKNEAFNEMNALIKRESDETTLEMLIKALGYSDALVRIDGEQATITVMSAEMSKEKANEIIYLAKTELENVSNVSVNTQSSYY